MVEQDTQALSDLLKAVSDATRRSLLTYLSQHGPTRVTDLAALYDMSLNACSKHIKVLEKSGLVSRTTIGRSHLIEAKLGTIKPVQAWLDELSSIWELRLNKLNDILAAGEKHDD
ncbi:ArsR/SmtB family transcription factor [Agaribacterium haliotis]|uniref:ArsR/SmtB family transcription factor n=1 Tax=Agaribacterium haliotis TaxID=2013869 RepID=UPI000BB54639|nr:metalloregulator ArsR/SmtB family transcription factor [Agaribacterium haliotis]